MTANFRYALCLGLLLAVSAGHAMASPAGSSDADEQAALAVRTRLTQPDAAAAIYLDRVEVQDGVVLLTGSAPNRFALAAAVRVTKEVPGVRSVKTRVRVTPNP